MAERRWRTVLTGGSYFEGPRWHEGAWWVSDFYRHTVSRVGADGSERTVAEVEAQPSGLGWLPDGTLLVVSMKDHRVLRLTDGGPQTHADLAPYCAGPLNDMVVDAVGHVFVGDFGFDLMGGAPFAPTGLKRVDPDGTVTVAAADLHFPNGAVITPDGATLVVGETWGNRFTAFDLAPDGSLTNRRVWARFGELPQGTAVEELIPQVVLAPDGCTMDAEGHVWVADGLNGRVCRVAAGGTIVDEVAAPEGMGVFACALGGEDGRTLLACAAPDFLEHNRAPVREAVLVATEVEVPHAGLP